MVCLLIFGCWLRGAGCGVTKMAHGARRRAQGEKLIELIELIASQLPGLLAYQPPSFRLPNSKI